MPLRNDLRTLQIKSLEGESNLLTEKVKSFRERDNVTDEERYELLRDYALLHIKMDNFEKNEHWGYRMVLYIIRKSGEIKKYFKKGRK